MSLEILAIGSDNLVRLDALTSASSGGYLNNATVSFTLTDSNGNVVAGLSNVSMPYVAGSNGRYEGNIPNTANLVLNALYTLAVTATASGYKLYRKLSCIAKYRSEW